MASWTVVNFFDSVEQADHESDGLSNLLDQYIDKPRMRSFLASLLENIDELEQASIDVYAGMSPYTAIGNQLDILGKIAGQNRGELTDDQYRLFILARILVNRSNGTIPELIEIIERLGIAKIEIREYFPSAYDVAIFDTDNGEVITELMQDHKPAGVKLLYKYSANDSDEVFRFSKNLLIDTSTVSGGFSTYSGTGGGNFVSVGS